LLQFNACDAPQHLITQLSNDWQGKVTVNKASTNVWTDVKQWTEFKGFCGTKMVQIYRDNPDANCLLTKRITALEANQVEMSKEQGVLAVNQETLQANLIKALLATTGGAGTVKPVNEGTENNPPATRATKKRRREWRQHQYYCWTHGYNCRHPSDKCPTGMKIKDLNRKPGHKDTATHVDHQGGSMHMKERYLKWIGPNNELADEKPKE